MVEIKSNEHSHIAKGSRISGFSTQLMYLGLFLFLVDSPDQVLLFYSLSHQTSTVPQPSDALGNGSPP